MALNQNEYQYYLENQYGLGVLYFLQKKIYYSYNYAKGQNLQMLPASQRSPLY